MDDMVRSIIGSQYGAALGMLVDTLENCCEDVWHLSSGNNPCWKIAYHTVFYAHLYMCTSEDEFSPAAFHYEDAQFLGTSPYPPFEKVRLDKPIQQSDVLNYTKHVLESSRKIEDIPMNVLLEPCVWPWIDRTLLELLCMSTRHIQHHTAQIQMLAQVRTEWRPSA